MSSPMLDFKGRVYGSLSGPLTDMRMILSKRKVLRSAMGGGVDGAFRERLMLVVTAVNGCRYCSYAHARQGLSEGISEEEINLLAEQAFDDSPSEQVSALLYAQHWAETNGCPDPAVRTRVADHYGEDVLEEVEAILLAIRIGNLLGNTFDALLHRLSFGRLGGT